MQKNLVVVPCGCIFEADGEMAMVEYCAKCEAAMAGLAKLHSCPDCEFTAQWREELDAHIVEVHLGIVLAPLSFVFPDVAA